jgi:RNA-directed DNA polymerase
VHLSEDSMIQAPQELFFANLEGDIEKRLSDPKWVASHEDYLPPVYIPKRNGGRRKIMEPKPYLKEAQRRINRLLESWRYGPSMYAHGFVNHRGRRTNALPHVGHSRMLKVDIVDFFGNCTTEKVIDALRKLEPPDWFLQIAVRICILNGGLPQGSPSSPMLSNIVARELDYRIAGLCKSFHERFRDEPGEDIVYTRYADDLTFTSDWDQLYQLRFPVGRILGECGFEIKPSKTKYFNAPARLESCGVVVSKEKINARRRDRLYWRGRLHKMVVDIKHNNVPRGRYRNRRGKVSRISSRMLRRIRGKIAAISDISPQDKEKLFSKFNELRNLCR